MTELIRYHIGTPRITTIDPKNSLLKTLIMGIGLLIIFEKAKSGLLYVINYDYLYSLQ